MSLRKKAINCIVTLRNTHNKLRLINGTCCYRNDKIPFIQWLALILSFIVDKNIDPDLSLVAQALIPALRKTGRIIMSLQIWTYPGLYSKFQTSLHHTRISCLKRGKEIKKPKRRYANADQIWKEIYKWTRRHTNAERIF